MKLIKSFFCSCCCCERWLIQGSNVMAFRNCSAVRVVTSVTVVIILTILNSLMVRWRKRWSKRKRKFFYCRDLSIKIIWKIMRFGSVSYNINFFYYFYISIFVTLLFATVQIMFNLVSLQNPDKQIQCDFFKKVWKTLEIQKMHEICIRIESTVHIISKHCATKFNFTK